MCGLQNLYSFCMALFVFMSLLWLLSLSLHPRVSWAGSRFETGFKIFWVPRTAATLMCACMAVGVEKLPEERTKPTYAAHCQQRALVLKGGATCWARTCLSDGRCIFSVQIVDIERVHHPQDRWCVRVGHEARRSVWTCSPRRGRSQLVRPTSWSEHRPWQCDATRRTRSCLIDGLRFYRSNIWRKSKCIIGKVCGVFWEDMKLDMCRPTEKPRARAERLFVWAADVRRGRRAIVRDSSRGKMRRFGVWFTRIDGFIIS